LQVPRRDKSDWGRNYGFCPLYEGSLKRELKVRKEGRTKTEKKNLGRRVFLRKRGKREEQKGHATPWTAKAKSGRERKITCSKRGWSVETRIRDRKESTQRWGVSTFQKEGKVFVSVAFQNNVSPRGGAWGSSALSGKPGAWIGIWHTLGLTERKREHEDIK